MKVLGWLNNKSKHNSTTSLKTSREYRSYFACSRQHEVEFKKYSTELKLEIEEDRENEGSVNELFIGFLAIGTLGGELMNNESPTPTFGTTFEDTTNEEHIITENELKIVSSKLEEFLEAEDEESANKTSARSSHASVITLSNDQSEETNTAHKRHIATCPLQKYLFGSSHEFQEAEMPIKKETNLLGKLFKRNTSHTHREGMQEPRKKKAKKRDAPLFLKMMLRMIHSVSVITKSPPGDDSHGSLLKKKLSKVFRLIPNKVHPEASTTHKKLTKSCNKRFEESICKSGYQGANPAMVTNISVPPTPSREHWIKTDTEYLVLEL